jgi:predicted branched-subunit amino acid permease
MTTSPPTGVVAAAIPVAAPIGAFGIVYGALAGPVIGAELTVISSLLVFSGAAQFTMVGLLAAGATAAGVLGAVATLALRHLPLSAVLQPLLPDGRFRRALLAWFLLDETTGLALTQRGSARRTLLISGGLAYAAWLLGTVIGVAGGSIAAVEPLAVAVFPVLFVGLAALTASTRWDGVRAWLAGGVSLGLLVVWPGSGALGAIGVAVAVAIVVAAP